MFAHKKFIQQTKAQNRLYANNFKYNRICVFECSLHFQAWPPLLEMASNVLLCLLVISFDTCTSAGGGRPEFVRRTIVIMYNLAQHKRTHTIPNYRATTTSRHRLASVARVRVPLSKNHHFHYITSSLLCKLARVVFAFLPRSIAVVFASAVVRKYICVVSNGLTDWLTDLMHACRLQMTVISFSVWLRPQFDYINIHFV